MSWDNYIQNALAFDPWGNLRRLESQMRSAFNELETEGTGEFPLINVYGNEERAILTAEIPGMKIEDIELTSADNVLTLKGEYKPYKLEEGEKWHRRERMTGQFVRTVELPFPVEADKIEASYSKGVLTVTLPRAERDKPKKISIK